MCRARLVLLLGHVVLTQGIAAQLQVGQQCWGHCRGGTLLILEGRRPVCVTGPAGSKEIETVGSSGGNRAGDLHPVPGHAKLEPCALYGSLTGSIHPQVSRCISLLLPLCPF